MSQSELQIKNYGSLKIDPTRLSNLVHVGELLVILSKWNIQVYWIILLDDSKKLIQVAPQSDL